MIDIRFPLMTYVSTVRDSEKTTMLCARSADHTDNCTVNFMDVGTAHCSHTVSLR